MNSPEANGFRNFVRMKTDLFENLSLVSPEIEKTSTIMSQAIPVTQRLSTTLRYLATGNTFEIWSF